MCLFAAAEELWFRDIEIDGVFLEGVDGETDGNNRGNDYYANTDTELWNGNGAEAVSKHQSNGGGKWEIGEELDDEIRLGSHKERHEVEWQDHYNNSGADKGRSIAGGGNEGADEGADASIEDRRSNEQDDAKRNRNRIDLDTRQNTAKKSIVAVGEDEK